MSLGLLYYLPCQVLCLPLFPSYSSMRHCGTKQCEGGWSLSAGTDTNLHTHTNTRISVYIRRYKQRGVVLNINYWLFKKISFTVFIMFPRPPYEPRDEFILFNDDSQDWSPHFPHRPNPMSSLSHRRVNINKACVSHSWICKCACLGGKKPQKHILCA